MQGDPDHPHHPGFDGLDLRRLRDRPGVKWRRVADGVIPAWVADMDFPVCPVITEHLADLLAGGDLGYPDWAAGTPLRDAFADRMAQRFGWQPDPAAVREIADLVQGVQVVLRLATRPGDAVALHVPTYPPFLAAITSMGRRPVPIPMLGRPPDEHGWGFDPGAMDDAVARARARVLLLVNPHNPTGRVLTRAELEAVAGTAQRHDLLVIADEIHADLVYAPHHHLPFATLDPDAAGRTVTLTSPSKAFNLAGLRAAVMHVGPADLLRVHDAQPSDLFGRANLFGVHAALAAWSPNTRPWQEGLLAHLDANRRRVVQVLGERLPQARVIAPEGTYLAWIDVRALGLGERPEAQFRRLGVRLSPGRDFGPGGEGFVRLNFATSADILDEVLGRITAWRGFDDRFMPN
jgi:cysteine-S-conjugate beta-lyase